MILPRRGREAGSCEPNPCLGGVLFCRAALGAFLSGSGCLLPRVRRRHNSAAQAGDLCGCGGMAQQRPPRAGSSAFAVRYPLAGAGARVRMMRQNRGGCLRGRPLTAAPACCRAIQLRAGSAGARTQKGCQFCANRQPLILILQGWTSVRPTGCALPDPRRSFVWPCLAG